MLLSFSTDPYQPIDEELAITREAIRLLHKYGLVVEILTKGGTRAIRDFDLLTSRDAFATTLTFLDDGKSKEWEPWAALPGDRLLAMQEAHKRGIRVWASLEPVIDPEESLEIIRQTHEYVDLYKVGKLNYNQIEKTIDWREFAENAIKLLEQYKKNYYIKDDLRKYLEFPEKPKGADNMPDKPKDLEIKAAEIENDPEEIEGEVPEDPMAEYWKMPLVNRHSDIGNAFLLRLEFGNRAFWCPEDNCWYFWHHTTGWSTETHIDRPGCPQTIQGYAEKVVQYALPNIAASTGDKEDLRWAKQSSNNAKVNAMIERSKAFVTRHKSEFDNDPFLLKVENGVINLETGEFREHRISDKLLKKAAVTYDPNATCPIYDRFMNQIMLGDQEMVTYLDKVLGYSLTGDISEEVFFVFYGKGQDGKSKLIETISALIGDYGHKAESKTILQNQTERISEGIASMAGKRLVYVSETGDGQAFNEGRIKELTGDEFIRARLLYSNSIQFKQTYKIFLLTNKRPAIAGTDKGIWRRVRIIPFNLSIPDEERDNKLAQKLRAELPGILNRLIRGCLLWQQEGLEIPAKVQQAIDAYKEEMDVIGEFLKECCIISNNPKDRVGILPLYIQFREWAKGVGEDPLTTIKFRQKLLERGLIQGKSGNRRYWAGIRLKE